MRRRSGHNEGMRPGTDTPPVLAGVLQIVATLAVVIDLAFGSSPEISRPLTALGLLIMVMVGLVGLFVARGRWARRYLWLTLIVESGLFVAFGSVWIVAGLILAAGFALAMPAIDGWTRQLRRADAPPNPSVLLPLMLLAIPVLLGLSGESGLLDWIFALTTAAGAWSYGRAHQITLWWLRLGYPLFGVFVSLAHTDWFGAVVALVVGAVAVVAWLPGSMRGIRPLEARRVEAKPVFAEMAPPGLMDQIGRDRRGRRKP